ETRIDADLHLGRHAEVIAELRQLAATHRLRERLHGLLMLALYQDGRLGEALAAYQQARAVLIEELGTEPGAGLSQVHQQILAGDPALMMPEPALQAGGRPAAARDSEAPRRSAVPTATAGRRVSAPMRSGVDVFPVAIGYYADADLADLDVE